jgi:hypothetical protein
MLWINKARVPLENTAIITQISFHYKIILKRQTNGKSVD